MIQFEVPDCLESINDDAVRDTFGKYLFRRFRIMTSVFFLCICIMAVFLFALIIAFFVGSWNFFLTSLFTLYISNMIFSFYENSIHNFIDKIGKVYKFAWTNVTISFYNLNSSLLVKKDSGFNHNIMLEASNDIGFKYPVVFFDFKAVPDNMLTKLMIRYFKKIGAEEHLLKKDTYDYKIGAWYLGDYARIRILSENKGICIFGCDDDMLYFKLKYG